MYTSTTIRNDEPLKAWRVDGDPDIWFGSRTIGAHDVHSVTLAEAVQLVAELQRELSAVEAQARSAAA